MKPQLSVIKNYKTSNEITFFSCFLYQSVKTIFLVSISFYFYPSPHFLVIISFLIRRFSPWFHSFSLPFPHICTLIPCISTSIPHVSTPIPGIPTLIPCIPINPLIPFPDSLFHVLQTFYRFCYRQNFIPKGMHIELTNN